MIIRNNFNANRRFNNNENNQNSYLDEQKKVLCRSIDNLDKRYKNGEVDLNKFKKIANSYAERHQNLNNRINKNH